MKYRKLKRTYDGIAAQRMLVVPAPVLEMSGDDELLRDLYVHSIGHYPTAKYHYIERPKGAPEYILIYCTAGKGWYALNGKEYLVSENQVFILPANEPHSYEADADDPWSIYWMHFKGTKAAFLASGFSEPVKVNPDFDHRIPLFDEVYHTLKHGFDKEHLMHANLTASYFISSFRTIEGANVSERKNSGEYSESITNVATYFMRRNIDKPLKMADVSQFTGYSPPHLHKLFVRATGLSPMQYFLNLKIERACYYLSQHNYKVSQVARILGFKDSGHFSKMFIRIKGVPPSKYRNQSASGQG